MGAPGASPLGTWESTDPVWEYSKASSLADYSPEFRPFDCFSGSRMLRKVGRPNRKLPDSTAPLRTAPPPRIDLQKLATTGSTIPIGHPAPSPALNREKWGTPPTFFICVFHRLPCTYLLKPQICLLFLSAVAPEFPPNPASAALMRN